MMHILVLDRGALKTERLERALTRRDLALLAHMNDRTIERLENGRHMARPSTIRQLACGLGVHVSAISQVVEL